MMPSTPTVRHEPDPIFAAIEAHREEWAKFDAAVGKARRVRPGSKASRKRSAATAAYDECIDALILTPIATAEGLFAYIDYLASLQAYGEKSPGPYPIEVWHLADAMERVSRAFKRIAEAEMFGPLFGAEALP